MKFLRFPAGRITNGQQGKNIPSLVKIIKSQKKTQDYYKTVVRGKETSKRRAPIDEAKFNQAETIKSVVTS